MTCLISPEQERSTLDRLEQSWRDILKPPSDLPVDQWVEKNIVLAGASQSQGRIDLNRTPFARDVLNCLLDPHVERVTNCTASQIFKSLTVIEAAAYWCCERHEPVMIGTATEDLAAYLVNQKLDPVFNTSPNIRAQLRQGRYDDTTFVKRFKHSTLEIAGGGAITSAIGRSVGLLLLDEIDHMASGVYANYLQRIKGYQGAKIFECGTPELETGILWTRFQKGSREFWQVRCPHCDERQKLLFDNLKWSKAAKIDEDEWDADLVKETTYYRCPNCKGRIEDQHKYDLLLSGQWVADNPKARSHRSFTLNSIYSPFLTFGEVAKEFIESEHHPEKVKAFRGGWLAQPWNIATAKQLSNRVLDCCRNYKRGRVPCPPSAIVLAADFGKKRIHWVVSAIAAADKKGRGGGATFVVDFGTVDDLPGLVEVAARPFDGFLVTHKGIDCGYSTPDLRDFCAQNQWWPIFGRTNIGAAYQFNKNEGHLLLNSDLVKDVLHEKIDHPKKMWNLFANDGLLGEYVEHLSAEERIIVPDPYGFGRRKWNVLSTLNHFLDATYYVEGIALAFGLRFGRPLAPIKTEEQKEKEKVDKPKVVERPAPSPFDRLDKYGKKWG